MTIDKAADATKIIEKIGHMKQTQQSGPRQGCDDPVRIHTLRKYIGQTEDMTGVELVKAKQ